MNLSNFNQILTIVLAELNKATEVSSDGKITVGELIDFIKTGIQASGIANKLNINISPKTQQYIEKAKEIIEKISETSNNGQINILDSIDLLTYVVGLFGILDKEIFVFDTNNQ